MTSVRREAGDGALGHRVGATRNHGVLSRNRIRSNGECLQSEECFYLFLSIEGVKTVLGRPDVVVEDVIGRRAGDNTRVRTLNIRFIAEYKYFCQLLSKL